MTDLIKHITNKDFESANKTLEENFKVILEGKLHEMKKMCAATMEQNTHGERQKRLKMDVLEQETYDSSTGASTNRTTNTSQIRTNKYGDEKKSEDPDEEGDETHIVRQSRETSDGGNTGTSRNKELTSRFSSKTVRPDKGDGRGGDFEMKSSNELTRSSESKPIGPYKTDKFIPGETPVSEGLLKAVGDKLLKLKSPTARANAGKRPVMRNIAGKPMQKLKIAPKRLEEDDDASEESSMARSELQAMTKDAKSIMSNIKGNKELEAWTQSKITKAADYINSVADYMEGEKEETLDEAQVSLVKLRIRGGKVQRRKKVSNVPGMTLRGGKLTRMSPAERRRRKLGAVKAARKTRSKKSQILRKRKLSLMKRSRLGG